MCLELDTLTTSLVQMLLVLFFTSISIIMNANMIALTLFSLYNWILSKRNYFLYVKCHPMGGHKFCCFQIHDQLTQMYFMLHCKHVILSTSNIVCIFIVFVYLHLIKTYNIIWFATIVTIMMDCLFYFDTTPLWYHDIGVFCLLSWTSCVS